MNVLNYTDTGNGPVVVLLHGFCESNSLWNFFSSGLSKYYRVICPDFPGFGETPFLQDEISIEELADHVKYLIDDLNISVCTLIGHSLGGYVGLAFAEKYPEKLNGLGLFHSTAFADSDQKKVNRNKTISFLEEHGIKKFAQSFVSPLFAPEKRTMFSEDIENLTKVCASSNNLAVIAVTKAMRDRLDRTEVLKNLEIPVLYIVGKEDTAVTLESSLAQICFPKNAIVHLLDNVGHMGMIENKSFTFKAVKTFTDFCNA